MAPETYEAPEPDGGDDAQARRLRSMRKWIVVGAAVVFFGYLMTIVINPYEGQRFEEVPHGDHVHYVPKDRNPDVPIGEFPTQKPGPDETITPEGDVVPAGR
jgi:hypothetical protein